MTSEVVEWLATPAPISVIPLFLVAFKGFDAANALRFIKPASIKQIACCVYAID
jgi:hypothetical protein